MPYGTHDKTWTSCTANGLNTSWQLTSDGSEFSQKTNSPVQSTPGGGIAYRKYKVAGGVQKEYLFIPDHDGNIARLEITGWSGSGTTAKPTIPIANITKLITPEYLKGTRAVVTGVTWKTSFITSMEFDYAGNLVTTAGKGNHDAPQDIVIYTMPYPDRVNAQEIQAPNSCRFIPERLSQSDMKQQHIDNIVTPYIPTKTCYLELYRPLQAGTFNTIALPFDLSSLNNTPYAGAEVMRFTGTELKEVGGENILYFNFEKVTFSGSDIMKAGHPYVINPSKDVVGIVAFDDPIQFKKQCADVEKLKGGEDYAEFVGFFPYQDMPTNPKTLMLISDNRLAEIEEGRMNGFRAYFQLQKAVPANTLSLLNFRRNSTTDTDIVVDGQKLNIQKFIREGRVYIRAGETLYTITGEVVGDRR